jgi:uncharacterized membrane protein
MSINDDQTPGDLAWGVTSDGEHRWPASLAVLAAMALNQALPTHYIMGPPWLVPVLELSILLQLSITAPRRVANEGRLQQVLALITIAILTIANLGSLILLVTMLLHHGRHVSGVELAYSALGIWLTNVIVFALWYWEIDRGGPDQRTHKEHPEPDFLFPQMATPGCAHPSWVPKFTDYLYLAFTNATAFSPTDAMPLTPWAKRLMLTQAAISLLTIILVVARAVSTLR